MLQQTRWIYLFKLVFSFSSDKYPEVGLLDHMVALFLTFWGTSMLFSIVATLVYCSLCVQNCHHSSRQWINNKNNNTCRVATVGQGLHTLPCLNFMITLLNRNYSRMFQMKVSRGKGFVRGYTSQKWHTYRSDAKSNAHASSSCCLVRNFQNMWKEMGETLFYTGVLLVNRYSRHTDESLRMCLTPRPDFFQVLLKLFYIALPNPSIVS